MTDPLAQPVEAEERCAWTWLKAHASQGPCGESKSKHGNGPNDIRHPFIAPPASATAQQMPEELPLSNYYAVDAEGHRFGLATCLLCGSAIILDKDGAVTLHSEWHEKWKS